MQLPKAAALLAACISTVYADTVWLAMCGVPDKLPTTPEMVYSASGILTGPPAGNDIGTLVGGGPKVWEGFTQVGVFPEAAFTSRIIPGANAQPVGGYAGTGRNSFNNYTCYRDNQELLYEEFFQGTGMQCVKEYYCLSD